MRDLLFDLRYALRLVKRQRGFSALSVGVLALGIGAAAGMFSVVNAVLLHPLPFSDPDRLVAVSETIRRDTVERRSVAYANFLDWRADARVFSAMAAYSTPLFTLSGDGEPERVNAEAASAGYFDLLGAAPAFGRAFTREEDRASAERLVVLGDGLWRRRFGADASIVGRTITVNERSATVIGVMKPGFRGVSDQADMWVTMEGPLGMAGDPALLGRRDRWHEVVARLAPSTTIAQAQAGMDAISARLEAAYADANRNRGSHVTPLADEYFGEIRPALRALLGAVGLLLALACANVASLTLVRGDGRRREMAVRAALGAGRGRLVRQLLVESVTLSLAGGALGVLASVWCVDLLLSASPVSLPTFVNVRVDTRMLAAALALAVGSGVLSGIVPAFSAARATTDDALRASGKGGPSASGRRGKQYVLVAAETALALVLLVGAGLMMRSLIAWRSLDPGFTAERVVTLRTSLPPDRYRGDARAAFVVRLLDRLRDIPSVRAASVASDVPLDGNASASIVRIEGRDDQTQDGGIRVYRHSTGPGYFAALGATLAAGRDFTWDDRGQRPTVMIVSRAMAARFWPGDSPIGARIIFNNAPVEIVGIASDIKHRSLTESATADPDIYLPILQTQSVGLSVTARTTADAAALAADVRRIVREIDPALPIYNVQTLAELLGQQSSQAQFSAALLSIFAGAALLLAVVGVYGVMAYVVSHRRAEFGVRMALGARPADLLRLVLRQGFVLGASGVFVGLLLALGLTRVLASQVVGVSPTDPATFATMAITLTAAALLASYLPALRATRIDPSTALRQE